MAAKVITFHQLIDAVVQDVIPGGVIAEEGGDFMSMTELRNIYVRTLKKADEIIAKEAEIKEK